MLMPAEPRIQPGRVTTEGDTLFFEVRGPEQGTRHPPLLMIPSRRPLAHAMKAYAQGVLWLMRKTHPTGWAIYPAAGWLALAVLSFIEGPRFADFWLATMFLVTGTVLLATLIVKVRLMASPQTPHLKGGKS